jgi:hypothetical protein
MFYINYFILFDALIQYITIATTIKVLQKIQATGHQCFIFNIEILLGWAFS